MQALASYARPAVAFVTAPSNSTSTNNTLALRVAGSLMIDLRADDYDSVRKLWDNRATPGPVSTANGDFGQYLGAPPPVTGRLWGPDPSPWARPPPS